jgi:hypothetical protein
MENIKEFASSEMQSMKQTTLRIYIESRLRMDKMELADENDIGVWMEALYATGGRNFENVWLELLIDTNNKIIPHSNLIKEAYGYLLENFNTCDGGKMEQLDRMNEVRRRLQDNTGYEWEDEAAGWFKTHNQSPGNGKVKRKMATLFDLKYPSQETPEQEEEEISDESEWTKEIRTDGKIKKTNFVSGRELDVIKANLQSLEQ